MRKGKRYIDQKTLLEDGGAQRVKVNHSQTGHRNGTQKIKKRKGADNTPRELREKRGKKTVGFR